MPGDVDEIEIGRRHHELEICFAGIAYGNRELDERNMLKRIGGIRGWWLMPQ